MSDCSQSTPNSILEVANLEKQFGSESVLTGVNLFLQQGETLSVLGRSGSGKTTLLKIIAGLEQADAGQIMLQDRQITKQPPQQRGIVYLYQEPLLLPHLNLFENMAFGLRLQNMAKPEIKKRTLELIEQLGLENHLKKMPHQLSGGQRQRVAFGRAIIVKPNVLLLDEPFGNLDIEIRTQVQHLFKQITGAYQIPAIFVTHDLKEAILMGDRLAFMRNGRLKTYKNQQEFIQDPESGVAREVQFWLDLSAKHHQ